MLESSKIVLLVSLIAAGCGEANFTSTAGTKDLTGKELPATAGESMRLTWVWPCEGKDIRVGDESENHIVVEGAGPHRLDASLMDGATVSMKGSTCGADDLNRQIVFVIDVSGSMVNGGFDRAVNGRCARLDAIEQVIQTTDGEGTSYGIVTYNGQTQAQSTALFASRLDLYSDVVSQAGAGQISDVVCAGNGDTNYEEGLTSAAQLLGGEFDGLKEVYFVSDGVPSNGQDGAAQAQELRDDDVTIATVMVGSADDSVLRNQIASKDEMGAPLHARVEQADELAATLADLADNRVTSGFLLYGGPGTTPERIDLTDKFSGSIFSFEAFRLNIDDAPDGLEVELNYEDRFGQTRSNQGEIQWTFDSDS